jgi:tetraacyldisaccharide 4'-kinase
MRRSVSTIHEILSHERKGFGPGLLRLLLLVLSFPYRLVVAVRNRLYDRKLKAVRHLDSRVISVGNLTTGGTGKTPLVEYLARHLLSRGKKVVIVSRGYGGRPGEPDDEKLVLGENLPGVPHVTGKDRVVCGRTACEKYGAEVILMDDGFQHRRLARELDIVAIDATLPFGYGHHLPWGLLRESPGSLRRAHVVVITRSKLVKPEELTRLEKDISKLAPGVLIVHASEELLSLQDLRGNTRPPQAGRPVVAFCGVGNPEAFRRTVTGLGVQLAAFLVFSDHHRYTPEDLEAIDAAAGAEKAELILTTQKDRVKLPADFPWRHELFVVKIGMHITKGEEALHRLIEKVISDAAQPPAAVH